MHHNYNSQIHILIHLITDGINQNIAYLFSEKEKHIIRFKELNKNKKNLFDFIFRNIRLHNPLR